MNRIEIALPGTAPHGATGKGATAEPKGETKLDEAFQKLIKKLNGELAKGERDAVGEAVTDEHPATGKRSAKHGMKTEAPAENGPHGHHAHDDRNVDADLANMENVDPVRGTETDGRGASLPELLLQTFPAKSEIEKISAGTDLQNRSATQAAGGAQHAAHGGKECAGTAKADALSGRDPFAALTSLLAKEDIGTETEAALPETEIKAPKLTVLVRETHFEPVVRTPPAQQVASAIVSNLGAMAEQNSDADPPETTRNGLDSLSLHKASDGPLKILHIKLEPNDLGEVSVKMRLVGDSLEIRLEASRAETADLLTRDKDMLHRLLRTSGYSPDVVTIQAVGDTASSQSSNGQAGQNGGASAHNPAPSHGGAQPDGRRQDGEARPVPDSFLTSETTYDDPSSASDGNLYL